MIHIRIYVNKTKNRTTLIIETRCYLELLKPEAIKLLQCTGNKTTKNKNGEYILHLEITEVILVYSNTVNNDYQQDSRFLYKFVPNKPFGRLLEISPTACIF